jgi:hypothetical protein
VFYSWFVSCRFDVALGLCAQGYLAETTEELEALKEQQQHRAEAKGVAPALGGNTIDRIAVTFVILRKPTRGL